MSHDIDGQSKAAKLVWWEVQGPDGGSVSDYDTEDDAIRDCLLWWRAEYPGWGPYRVVRYDAYETEVNTPSEYQWGGSTSEP